jgi:RHS repeat-associated protein
MALLSTPSGSSITLSADPKWLTDPARKWPVTIDPTIRFVGDSQDCFIVSLGYQNNNYCGLTYMNVGWGTSGAARTVVQFNLQNSIPANAQVLLADLGLFASANSPGLSTPVSLYQVTQNWDGGATWNCAKAVGGSCVSQWSTPGGTFNASAATTTNIPGTTRWFHWYPTQLAQNWLNGTANQGVILKESTENVNNIINFVSSYFSNSSFWPNLTVTYDPGVGERPFYNFESQNLDDFESLHVNVANGNLVLHANDLSIKGTGLDLSIARTFNGLGINSWDLGRRWTMDTGWDVFLDTNSDGSKTLSAPGGYPALFTVGTNGQFVAPSGLDAMLTTNADGSYTLTYNQSSEKYNFTAGGALISDVDRNGNKIVFAYDTSKRLASITDTQGRITTFSYANAANSNLITTIADPASRNFRYAYDTNSNLTAYTDPNLGVTKYGYDAVGDLTQVIDPKGNTTNLTYDGNLRVTGLTRVTNPTTGTGPTTTFTYNAGNTVETDANGNRTTYTYDAMYRVTQVVDPLLNSPSTTYTADSNIQQYKDAGGAATIFTWDTSNNLTVGTAPTGAQATVAYSDTLHPFLPTGAKDEQGNILTYTYDANGNRTSITDGLAVQNKVTFTYNANGTRASMTDALGNVTSYGYDLSGNPTSVTYPAPLGADAKTYDGLSRVTKEIDGKGQSTSFAYDALDRLTSVTYADLSTITYAYDTDGNQTSVVDNTGTTTYGYDALNRMTQKTLPNGATMSYGYDAVGNLTSLTDAGGTVAYAYNAANLLISLTEPNGSKTTFAYDPDYNRTSTAYPNGVTMSVAYDASRRLQSIAAKNAVGTTLTSYTYSYTNPATLQDAGLRYSVTDVASNKMTYTYDVLNRLTEAKTTNSAGTITADYQYSYDGNGNRTSQTINGSTTTLTFNNASEISGTGYGYDANGNQTSRAGGMTFTLNEKDQTASISPPSASTINMTYANRGQTERVGAGAATYAYNVLGLGTDGQTSFTRDTHGALTEERTSSGNYYYLFDGLISVVGLTDATGNLVATYSYDPYGQLMAGTGTVTNPWRFAGGYLDASSGLYKMGDRYYDPTLGRWTQPDAAPASETDPVSANQYVYVGDDPINHVDPNGQYALVADAGGGGGGGGGAILVGAAVAAVVVGVWGWLGGVIHYATLAKGRSRQRRESLDWGPTHRGYSNTFNPGARLNQPGRGPGGWQRRVFWATVTATAVYIAYRALHQEHDQ